MKHNAYVSTPAPPSGPTHFGRYAVRRRIGSGGFATVWLAYDEQLDGPVAVKVLADNWAEQHEVRNRFVEEGRYLRRVESPHVVPVYDAGTTDDGRPFLVMAYADQGSLADRLEQGGVTVPQALELVSQVGLGLQALHDRGILHRDVKPANVLFRTVDPAAGVNGVRAMVGDLGLGKALDVSSRLTMIAGTPAYVAPEQAQGEAPDARADQFSLAVLTYLLLAGRLPWQHATLPAAAAGSESAPLSAPGREFPDGVEQVIRRALAHDRQWRWPSVTAYLEHLGHELTQWDGGAIGAGTRVLPIDPALTMPGARPTMGRPGDPQTPYVGSVAAPTPPRRRGRSRPWPGRSGGAAGRAGWWCRRRVLPAARDPHGDRRPHRGRGRRRLRHGGRQRAGRLACGGGDRRLDPPERRSRAPRQRPCRSARRSGGRPTRPPRGSSRDCSLPTGCPRASLNIRSATTPAHRR